MIASRLAAKCALGLCLLVAACVDTEGPRDSRILVDAEAELRPGIAVSASRALAHAEASIGHRVKGEITLRCVPKSEWKDGDEVRIESWALAYARRDRPELVVFIDKLESEPPNDLASVLEHEFVHVVIGALEREASPDGSRSVPTWLHEGLAQYYSGHSTLGANEDVLFYRARQKRLIRWGLLTKSWPRDRDEAAVAYAQSLSFVRFVHLHIGGASLRGALHDWLHGKAENLDTAVAVRARGRSIGTLTGDWRRELESGLGLFGFFRVHCFEFLLLVAVPLLGIVLYKRFRRELAAEARLEEWERIDEEHALGIDAEGRDDDETRQRARPRSRRRRPRWLRRLPRDRGSGAD